MMKKTIIAQAIIGNRYVVVDDNLYHTSKMVSRGDNFLETLNTKYVIQTCKPIYEFVGYFGPFSRPCLVMPDMSVRKISTLEKRYHRDGGIYLETSNSIYYCIDERVYLNKVLGLQD
jgi:hypothetical protein